MEGKGRHQGGLSFNIVYYFNQEVLLSFSLFGPFKLWRVNKLATDRFW